MIDKPQVLDVESAHVEIFFRCRRCHHSWHRSFTVSRWFEDDGGFMEVYRHHGVPVPSPRSGLVCVFCEGLPVDWAETPLPPLAAGEEQPAAAGRVAVPPAGRTVPWPSWRTPERDEWPPRRPTFPFLLPLRPQLHPRTFHFP